MVTWNENPQPAIPPVGETTRDVQCGMQRLGELLPAVLARHGLGEAAESSAAAAPIVAAPTVLPQSECPAG